MNCILTELSQTWLNLQGTLFPWIKEELGELTENQQKLITTLEVIRLENYLSYGRGWPGRPPADRIAIASAFVAKAVYNMDTTRILRDRLFSDIALRRICGWEQPRDIPSESTFSRSFAEFSQGMSLDQMHKDLPKACNVGSKKNAKGYKESWTGYKLHIDAADGGIPVSGLLSSASMHDSQAAIPLAQITATRISHCYDLMDAAYDAPQIREQSEKLGHVAIIDINPRRDKALKEELKAEKRRQKIINLQGHEHIRYNERSTVERVNGRFKDEFGGRVVRVKGDAKVMCHLMFGIVALTVDQLMKLIQ